MKKKDSKNYLDFVPEKNPEIEYEADEDGIIRSEEHTSELQSPNLISYAVFCLKKKSSIYPA